MEKDRKRARGNRSREKPRSVEAATTYYTYPRHFTLVAVSQKSNYFGMPCARVGTEKEREFRGKVSARYASAARVTSNESETDDEG